MSALAPALGARQVAVLSRALDGSPDPIALYASASDRGQRVDTLLLESGETREGSGEQSLVLTRAALRLSAHGHEVRVEALSPNGKGLLEAVHETLSTRADVEKRGRALVARFARPGAMNERERLEAPGVLDAVRAVLDLEVVGGRPPLGPLLAGSFAYDLLGAYEALPEPARDDTGWPDLELWLAEELVWIQHAIRRTHVLRYVFGGPDAENAYHDAATGLSAMVERCRRVPDLEELPSRSAPSGGRDEVGCDMDDEAFCAVVARLKEHIVAGDVFQIVPSRTFRIDCPDPLAAYRELRALNPSPYMFFVRGRAGALFGASPESALRVGGSPRRVVINPIAGTRPRARRPDGSVDADRDGRVEAELRLDEKELAEHLMLVDLARNDVARVCRPGTRATDRLLDVVRYSHVMHLVSLVGGELKRELDAMHAYQATMNMGTLTGAPKLKAAELLRRYEPTRRGPYGGAVGYVTAAGELDSCIVIRSALVVDGVAQVRAGCGVVYDSVPQAEADETRRKAQAVLTAIRRSKGRVDSGS